MCQDDGTVTNNGLSVAHCGMIRHLHPTNMMVMSKASDGQGVVIVNGTKWFCATNSK